MASRSSVPPVSMPSASLHVIEDPAAITLLVGREGGQGRAERKNNNQYYDRRLFDRCMFGKYCYVELCNLL